MSQLMDAKLKVTPSVEGKKKQASSFIKGLKEELKKVSWTTKAELIFCTKVVIWSTVIFGIGIYLMDLMIKGALELIKMVMHFIFG